MPLLVLATLPAAHAQESGDAAGRLAEAAWVALHGLSLPAPPAAAGAANPPDAGRASASETLLRSAWPVSGAQSTATASRLEPWQLTWRHAWIDSPDLSVKLGLTAKARDASPLFLGRSGTGFVPLLHAAVEQRLGERFSLLADIDAMAGPAGRTVDAGVRLSYAIDRDWSGTMAYRLLDGNIDWRDAQAGTARTGLLSFGLQRRW